MNRFTPSHEFVTCRRSPAVSSTAFDAQPPDLPPVRLMDMGSAIIGSLARHRRPPIRFLFIGSRLCSALLSGPPLAASVISPLRFAIPSHHVVKGTCTSKLSNMLVTPRPAVVFAGRPPAKRPSNARVEVVEAFLLSGFAIQNE